MKHALWLVNSSLVLIFASVLGVLQLLHQDPPQWRTPKILTAHEPAQQPEAPKQNNASWEKIYQNDIFEIHPLEVIRQIKSGKLAAIYHTHPSTEEEESKFDRFNCENSCIPYLIYSKKTQKFNLLVPSKPHVNKQYIEMLKKIYD